MLQEMKQKLAENIKKTNESGKLTARQVYDITRNSVAQTAQNLKGGARDLQKKTKEAVTTTVQTLMDAGKADQEKISAALDGAVDGVKQIESEKLNITHNELKQVKKRVADEKVKLAERLRSAISGARDAAGNFTGEVKDSINTASQTVVDRIKELGSETTHKTSELSGKAAHALGQKAKKLGAREVCCSGLYPDLQYDSR